MEISCGIFVLPVMSLSCKSEVLTPVNQSGIVAFERPSATPWFWGFFWEKKEKAALAVTGGLIVICPAIWQGFHWLTSL